MEFALFSQQTVSSRFFLFFSDHTVIKKWELKIFLKIMTCLIKVFRMSYTLKSNLTKLVYVCKGKSRKILKFENLKT